MRGGVRFECWEGGRYWFVCGLYGCKVGVMDG